MPLCVGDKLGPYEILAPIGEGGMGEVWKARDTRLDRLVALKVSKAAFGERFEREARAVAALNHPNICQLHDVGPNYLVMELIEGQPLHGPVPVAKAVEYALQILDALDAAHKKKITHRDLKPANILVTKQGLKLLDFGLAKQAAPLGGNDATLTELTARGQIVGTLHYMAPEQLQGLEADARSDLFAFGCVLYELLTGKRAFDGKSAASVIASILERQPAPLGIAPPLDRVIRRCLAKDPDERFQTARDLKAALVWTMEQPGEPSLAVSKRLWWIAAAIAIASAFCGWIVARTRLPSTQTEPQVMRFSIPPPEKTSYRDGKVSPDGRSLAFIGADASGKTQLWIRSLDSLVARPLGPAESAPFWSPDSRFAAFLQDGKLKKIATSGGAPQTICSAVMIIGASWNRDGTIVFGDGDAISQVRATGGEPKPLTRLDLSHKETTHHYPSFLPDGRHFLYTIHSAKRENGGVYVGSLDSPGDRIRLLGDVSNAEYASASSSGTGYLLFARGDSLMGQRFAAGNLKLEGEAFSVVEKITRSASNLSASFSASENGVLLINSSTLYNGVRLTWFDRAGKNLGTIGDPGLYFQPQLSPDGQTLAVDQNDPQRFLFDIFVLPLRGPPSRFTFDGAQFPLWSPDGGRISYLSSNALYVKTSQGRGQETLLLESGSVKERRTCDWSKDGRFIVYSQFDPKTKWDLWMLPLSGNRKPIPLLQTEFNEQCGRFSPDGKWFAYSSDEPGRSEVYVQGFSEDGAPGRKWQVSYTGGTWPRWRRDGRELFYMDAANTFVAVDVTTAGTFQSGTPKALFATGKYTPDTRFEVTADGGRFLIPARISELDSTASIVVLNWTKGIK